MRADEGLDLAKMAIACLLLCLLLGAVFLMWNMLYAPTREMEIGMEVSATDAVRERLMSLQDSSNAADADASLMSSEDIVAAHPLVTQVTHTLSEFDDNDLLFVFVCENKDTVTSNGWMFTYPGVTYSNTSILPVAPGPGQTINDSEVPTAMAVKHLRQYSKHRCHLTIAPVENGGNTYIGIIVEVLT